ncbi:Transposon TX1 uncharacterized protein [Chionoecetes opilio]|uniref:Transposon TX1 uncharacterized protein n=1 Tax=Chionoecetes opilio TaxID=41210 RepID=A0A8J5CYY0_CHIOP|nr:Transposon TX1 uncharacterized protein [Chionoecetes opilio]
MTSAGQSPRESRTLNQVLGPPSPTFSYGGGRGNAEAAPARRITPGINLRRVLRVGSWNVLSLSDDHRLPLLSGELSRLRVDIVGLSETRRPGSGETSSGGYTYYWSGMSNGHRERGVAIGISSKLQPSVVEVTPVDERIMRVRLKHTLGFMILVAVYAPTEMRKTEEEMFYAKLDSVLDQCPPRDTLIVLGDFNATTGTGRDGYELCVGPHGSGTRNTNSSLLLNFARSRRLRIAGSWYQRPELHRWTWYSNAGGVAKEIDHILVSTRWRILQNCRVYRSAEFFGTDHRLVVATLKLHFKSRRISRGNPTVFNLEKLKDLTCAHEYAVAVSNRFDVLGAFGDPVELWDTFKRETQQAAKECIGERPRSRRGFVSTETLEKIEESRAARLAGNRDQHRALSRRTRTLLGRDKERHVRSLAEDVEGHLNANDLRPAYRALKKLRSKSPSRASAIRTADGRLVSDMDGQMARWAEYFGHLFTVDPPTEQLHTTGLQAVDADPPIDESAPSLDEVREAVAKLRGGKAAGVCNISAELLKAGGEAMIHGLHAVLTAVWQSGTIPPDWKRGLVVPIWKGKGDRQDCNNYRGITLLSVPGKVLAHLLLTRIRSHLVKHQRPQQSGFTPGKSTTDRILALRVLVERRREFRQGMLAAYVDLKKAFDSVHRESLWDLLRLRGIPARTIGLITGLYSGTESAVKCRAGVSSFFPVNTGVRQGCILAPSLFNACMDWVLDKVVDQSDCGASVGNTKITDLVFADDAVIFAESLEVLVMALEALHEEAKPLGLEVSWLKTKVQVFGDLLDEAVQSVHACGEGFEILKSFTYLGSAVHNDGGSRQEVLRRIGIAHGVMDSLSGSIWRCRYLCRRTKIRIFKSLVIPVLLYGCETWTLNSDLKRRINAFGCPYNITSFQRALIISPLSKLTFAPEKTQAMVVSQSPAAGPAVEGRLRFGGVPLPLQEAVKVLGVEVDRELKFDGHIKHIAKKASRRVSALRRVVSFLDRGGKLLLYKAHIRPYLEYAALSWMSCAASHTRRLDSIQRRALRVVEAADPPAQPEPVSPLDSLEHRRDVAALVVFHKAQVQGVPHLAGLRQPPRVATRSTRTVLTNGDAVEVPRSNASQHQRTFAGRVSRMWNIFTAAVPHIQEMNTQSVKLAANRWILPKPTPLTLVSLVTATVPQQTL